MPRRFWMIALLVLSTGTWVCADDEPKPEQLKKMYEDTLAQLKQAQDRKNELAQENEKLNGKIGEMQKQLDADHVQLAELQRASATFAEQTFGLRSQQAAWKTFVQSDAKLEAKWEAYLSSPAIAPTASLEFLDRDWPLSSGSLAR